jgi:iron complex transport system substrate-binding protein
MMKKRSFIFGSWVLAFLLSACTPVPAATPTVEQLATQLLPTAAAAPTATVSSAIRITDGLGTEVELAAPAERIVALGASNTEILYALGADAQLAGCDQFSDYPADARAKAVISAGYGTLDAESIKALAPDLVLAAEIISADQVAALRGIGLNVFYVANPTALPEGLYANIRAIGTLTGRMEEAEALAAQLDARFRAVADRVAPLSPAPLVFFELDASDPARPYTAGTGSFVDMLITLAGGRNLGGELGTAWAQISAEEIFSRDPDLIILGDTAFGVTVESVAGRPGWSNLGAVKNGSVFALDSNLVLRPGPRLIDGLEALAALIHPEAFR